MAFGQTGGPPASRRQIETLTELVHGAGHVDFRDARGPLGLNQRQAGGRFTRDEADALIARLEADAERGPNGSNTTQPPRSRLAPVPAASRRDTQLQNSLHRVPAETLAAELQRRGWVVLEP